MMRQLLHGPLIERDANASMGELSSAIDAQTRLIDEAYWRFTRQARGVPCAIAAPDAYARRAWLSEALRRKYCGRPSTNYVGPSECGTCARPLRGSEHCPRCDV